MGFLDTLRQLLQRRRKSVQQSVELPLAPSKLSPSASPLPDKSEDNLPPHLRESPRCTNHYVDIREIFDANPSYQLLFPAPSPPWIDLDEEVDLTQLWAHNRRLSGKAASPEHRPYYIDPSLDSRRIFNAVDGVYAFVPLQPPPVAPRSAQRHSSHRQPSMRHSDQSWRSEAHGNFADLTWPLQPTVYPADSFVRPPPNRSSAPPDEFEELQRLRAFYVDLQLQAQQRLSQAEQLPPPPLPPRQRRPQSLANDASHRRNEYVDMALEQLQPRALSHVQTQTDSPHLNEYLDLRQDQLLSRSVFQQTSAPPLHLNEYVELTAEQLHETSVSQLTNSPPLHLNEYVELTAEQLQSPRSSQIDHDHHLNEYVDLRQDQLRAAPISRRQTDSPVNEYVELSLDHLQRAPETARSPAALPSLQLPSTAPADSPRQLNEYVGLRLEQLQPARSTSLPPAPPLQSPDRALNEYVVLEQVRPPPIPPRTTAPVRYRPQPQQDRQTASSLDFVVPAAQEQRAPPSMETPPAWRRSVYL